jgi:hypothetical protein
LPSINIQGKQAIFFSRNDANKPWRQYEKIIAAFEGALQPRDDVLTFSSVKVTDIIGRPEQVDIALVNPSNPSDYFSFVEVRNRDENVGRPYIQEVMGKKISLNKDDCKIVSTKGFAPDAITLATHQGISLRILLPETVQNIKKWFSAGGITINKRPLIRISKYVVVTKQGEGYRSVEIMGSNDNHSEILAPTGDPNAYRVIPPVAALNAECLKHRDDVSKLFDNIPEDGKFHQVAPITIEFPNKPLRFRLINVSTTVQDSPLIPIEAIVFFIEASKFTAFAPIEERYRYIDAATNEVMAQAILTKCQVEDKILYTLLARHSCDGVRCKLAGAAFY